MPRYAIQGVPLAQDFHVRLVHQPGRTQRFPVAADLAGQGRPERLDPAQARAAADVDAAVSQDASATFGGGAQLEGVADREQNDVPRKAMAGLPDSSTH